MQKIGVSRDEEIAKADAEIIEAARFVNETAVGAHIDEYTEGLRRLQAAFKARAALDEQPKPSIPTAEDRIEHTLVQGSVNEDGLYAGYSFLRDWISKIKAANLIRADRRETADLVRDEFETAAREGPERSEVYRAYLAARDRIIAALTST